MEHLRKKAEELFKAGATNLEMAVELRVTRASMMYLRRKWGLLHAPTAKEARPWTWDDDEALIKMRAEGKLTIAEMAKKLGRTYNGVQSRTKELRKEGRTDSRVRKSVNLAELADSVGCSQDMLKRLNRLRTNGKIHRNFTLEQMLRMYGQQKGLCYYTQIEMTADDGWRGESLSLDRIDSSLPYTYDNTVMCCAEVNRMKGELTIEELDWWVDKLVAGRG